ncbi:MAG: hypothetical protein R2860_12470 [Desulfobacterales bacterium]
MVKDYPTIARSMLAIGMTRKKWIPAKLCKDLEDFYHASETYGCLAGLSPGLEEPEQILLDMVRNYRSPRHPVPRSSPCF